HGRAAAAAANLIGGHLMPVSCQMSSICGGRRREPDRRTPPASRCPALQNVRRGPPPRLLSADTRPAHATTRRQLRGGRPRDTDRRTPDQLEHAAGIVVAAAAAANLIGGYKMAVGGSLIQTMRRPSPRT